MSKVCLLCVCLPDDADDTAADTIGTINGKQMMQSFGSLLLSKSRNDQVENAVEKDDNQNERVTIVLHLVDSDDEAVPLSED